MYEEEVKRVLKMVEEGKISPEEGAKLLKAIGIEEEPGKKKKGKFLLIQIYSAEGDSLNIKIPLKLMKVATKLIPKKYLQFTIGGEDSRIELTELLQFIEEEVGDYVDITSEDGDAIKISVI